MITGANSGIGKAMAMAIAKKGTCWRAVLPVQHQHMVTANQDVDVLSPGGTVHMVCRNKDKAEEAKEDIVTKSGNTVRVLALNMPYNGTLIKRERNPLIYERVMLNLHILGGIHPYCGHVPDTQSLGVCRGLQEAESITECVGMYHLYSLLQQINSDPHF